MGQGTGSTTAGSSRSVSSVRFNSLFSSPLGWIIIVGWKELSRTFFCKPASRHTIGETFDSRKSHVNRFPIEKSVKALPNSLAASEASLVHYRSSVVIQLPRVSPIRPEVAIYAIEFHGPLLQQEYAQKLNNRPSERQGRKSNYSRNECQLSRKDVGLRKVEIGLSRASRPHSHCHWATLSRSTGIASTAVWRPGDDSGLGLVDAANGQNGMKFDLLGRGSRHAVLIMEESSFGTRSTSRKTQLARA